MAGIRVFFTCDFTEQGLVGAGYFDMVLEHERRPSPDLLQYLERTIQSACQHPVLVHRWEMTPAVTKSDIYLTHSQELPINARHSRSPN
ncbi:hypothetical protein B7L88_gp047 [Rhizobium phage RHEph10]|uniref:hypothetical protein n=1 Tax=Rhizobium phage RHEph10 TaxID=1220717 RepID=UPI0002AB3FE5|nr:hypothetical protein B7L88_gp047 [Rhizobium phage RHEph10]AGC36091.1 hypothetical protein RHEph10_gp047 [Rhizobium phage RHEph10]